MFAGNTQYLALLNAKQQAGGQLTEAERAWLKQYYEELTPHFGEIKDWADKQLGLRPGAKPDQRNPLVQLVDRVGDGFLTLPQNVPYEELPQSARDTLASSLGVTDPSNQAGFFATPGERHIGEPWPPKTDPALLRAAGFVGLLNDYSSDAAAPGDGLAFHLKDAALRWKHQINVMYANHQADYPVAKGYGYGGPQLSEADWNRLMPDEPASDALGVVARNREFVSHWIIGSADERRELMGMNWQSGQGAASVLLAATMPGHGVPDERAAEAALVIVQDAATDYNGLAEMANSTVKAAIADIGFTYVDSFARFVNVQQGYVHNLAVAQTAGAAAQARGMDNVIAMTIRAHDQAGQPLIGLPTIFGMPGAKKQTNPVSIPARPAIALELLQPVAAGVAAFAAWPPIVAALVVVAALAACVLQLRRWRWMLSAGGGRMLAGPPG
jgi:hypothetical protein